MPKTTSAPRMHNVPQTTKTRKINPNRSRIFDPFETYGDRPEKVLPNYNSTTKVQ
jgi:hypothetical protein